MIIAAAALRAVEEHVLKSLPGEAYGFLVGRGVLGRREALAAQPGKDLLVPGQGLAITPGEFARVETRSRADGRDIVGFYQSLLAPPARPRPGHLTLWEGYSLLLLALENGAIVERRSFDLVGQEFDEETLEVRNG